MDELVKVLASKMGYTLTVIFGFGLPGNLLVFVWDRNLYLEMNIVKLIILSFGIAFAFFAIVSVSVFPFYIGLEEILKKKSNINAIVLPSVAVNILAIIGMIVIKILKPDYTIKSIIEEYGVVIVSVLLVVMAIGYVLNIIAGQINKRK